MRIRDVKRGEMLSIGRGIHFFSSSGYGTESNENQFRVRIDSTMGESRTCSSTVGLFLRTPFRLGINKILTLRSVYNFGRENLTWQVSFFSSSPELSNKQRFEFFTRTIPSDLHQVKAMVEIIRRLGWSYISILYEESTYGIKVSSPGSIKVICVGPTVRRRVPFRQRHPTSSNMMPTSLMLFTELRVTRPKETWSLTYAHSN